MCSLYQGLKLIAMWSEFGFHNRECGQSTGKHWGFYLNSLFSSSIKNDPTLRLVMPKFSFRLGKNK